MNLMYLQLMLIVSTGNRMDSWALIQYKRHSLTRIPTIKMWRSWDLSFYWKYDIFLLNQGPDLYIEHCLLYHTIPELFLPEHPITVVQGPVQSEQYAPEQ